MNLPPAIIRRIADELARTSPAGFHIDNMARRFGAIALMGTIGSVWLLRPDGTLWEVDDEFERPLQPLPEPEHTLALVAGVERFPWLAELLPRRPAEANDCRTCAGTGRLPNMVGATAAVLCGDCDALGWRSG